MNYTKQKIFNMALKNLKVSVPVSEENKKDKNYATLEEFYETAVKQVLEDTPWAFANAYRKLTLLSNETPLNPNYTYAYDVPNDVAMPREIVVHHSQSTPHFEIASVNKKLQLWCNVEDAVLRYTKQDVGESEFTSSFAMALSWYLAFLACPTISGARATQSDCMQIYQSQIQKAQISNANIDYPVNEASCNWLDARG